MNLRRLLDQTFIVITFLLMSSAFISHLVDLSTAESASGGSAQMQLIWASIYVITLARTVPHWKEIFSLMRLNLAFTLFSLFSVISILWSSDPSTTLRHGIAFLFSTLFGFDLARRYTLRDQLSLLTKMLTLAITLSLIIEVAFPNFAVRATFGEDSLLDATAWIGVYHQKNIFGHVLALAAVLILTQLQLSFRKLLVLLPALALCLFMIVKANSETALVVVFTTAYLLTILLLFRLRRRSLTTLGSAVGLLAAAAIVIALVNRDKILTLLGRDSNLTGRTGVWELVFQSIAQRPAFGYGFSAFWQVSYESKRIDQLLGWTVPSSHNLYIDIALQVGLVGLGLFVIAYLTGIKRSVMALQRYNDPAVLWPAAFLMLSMVYGFSESDLYSANSLYWVLVTSACISSSLYARPATQKHVNGWAYSNRVQMHTQTADAVSG